MPAKVDTYLDLPARLRLGCRAVSALGRRFWTPHRGCTSTRSPTSS